MLCDRCGRNIKKNDKSDMILDIVKIILITIVMFIIIKAAMVGLGFE